jgi:hypothetical protein
MLLDRFPADSLNLVAKHNWHPYPRLADRAAWENLPEPVRQYEIKRGEFALDFAWPSLTAVRFLDFARNGNRSHYEALHFERRGRVLDLVIAECVEGQGRFVDQLLNGLWLILEESYWGVPAHIGMQAAGPGLPDTADITVDLFAAETGALLANVLYLVGSSLDPISPLIRARIERKIDQRILTPCLERDDFGWMGFNRRSGRPNNWNPWICSNWLSCVLLVEADSERRRQSVAKIMRTLDNFLDPYPADGGCDEGPSYWGRAGASLYDNLILLDEATDGQVALWDDPLVQHMAAFIYRAQIADDYYINFADAPAVVTPDAALVYQFGQHIGDADMAALGAWLARRQGLFAPDMAQAGTTTRRIQNIPRHVPMLFSLAEMAEAPAYQPLPRDTWLPDIQVLVARDQARTADGFFLAAKGGHNAESHNHNDIGQFVVYVDGRPLLVDAGVETYTRKTFSAERYSIWTMQSGYHNLPTINGVMQTPGEIFTAQSVRYAADDKMAQLSLDIAPAYPPEANLQTWERSIRLERRQQITVVDSYQLAQPAEEITLNLLTPCTVDLSDDGVIQLLPAPVASGQSAAGQVRYDRQVFTAQVEVIDIDDESLRRAWGPHLRRVVLTALNPPPQATWTLTITR